MSTSFVKSDVKYSKNANYQTLSNLAQCKQSIQRHSLFSLYAPELRHVIAGDVALSTGVDASRLPPVSVLVVENLEPFTFLEGEILARPLVVVEESYVDGSPRRRMVPAQRQNGLAVTFPEAGSDVCRVADTHGRMERVRVRRLRVDLARAVDRIFPPSTAMVTHGRLGELLGTD